ncbi:hypothetical protein GUITHDRAFT_110128 [Guillardia theta CCMP2712]|uniref:Uncharacterized protein n=1 Tax=Guillardia theta (strain CCMP2712) TaxID=905079 RepID=L1J7E4_GUITC|nr:hypothetical protein GUITHDRAFT_110128 [Guillardia theta CCMP2712]EKX44024.1 hypothetical protein GUITHDRAFT_110128 [Guillardia theta CCMP2712]|eukprot:XP_005831004.1 hypothetical protein GUITHDRAFT_110128 [Guillardia theta CCMP2712]
METGLVEVRDAESMVLRLSLLPSKKDEGNLPIAMAVSNDSGHPVLYITRGGNALEKVTLFNQKNEKPLRMEGKWKPISAIQVSHARKSLVAIGLQDGEVRILDAYTLVQGQTLGASSADGGKHAAVTPLRSAVCGISFCETNESVMVVFHQQGAIAVWNLKDEIVECVRVLEETIAHGTWHPWLPHLYTLSSRCSIRCWSIVTGRKGGVSVEEEPRLACSRRLEFSSSSSESSSVLGCSKGPAHLCFHRRFNLFCIVSSQPPPPLISDSQAVLPVLQLVDLLNPSCLLPIGCSFGAGSDSELKRTEGRGAMDEPGHAVREDVVYLRGSSVCVFRPQYKKPVSVGTIPCEDNQGLGCHPVSLSYSSTLRMGLLLQANSRGGRNFSLLSLSSPTPSSSSPGVKRQGEDGSHLQLLISDAMPARDAVFVGRKFLALLSSAGDSIQLHLLNPRSAANTEEGRGSFSSACARLQSSEFLLCEAAVPHGLTLDRLYGRMQQGGEELDDVSSSASSSSPSPSTIELLGLDRTRGLLLYFKADVDGKEIRVREEREEHKLSQGEQVMQVNWRPRAEEAEEAKDASLAVLTSRRLMILDDEGRKHVEVPLPNLLSSIWIGETLCVSCMSQVFAVSLDGFCSRVATLECYGAVLCSCSMSSIAFLSHDKGSSLLYTRRVNLLLPLLRSALFKDDVSRALELVSSCDGDMLTPEVVQLLSSSPCKDLAIAVKELFLSWLPWHDQLSLAFAVRDFDLCLALLDAAATNHPPLLQELGSVYAMLADIALLSRCSLTAANALLRAGACGVTACLWRLLEQLREEDDVKGMRHLKRFAELTGDKYLALECSLLLGEVSGLDDLRGFSLRLSLAPTWDKKFRRAPMPSAFFSIVNPSQEEEEDGQGETRRFTFSLQNSGEGWLQEIRSSASTLIQQLKEGREGTAKSPSSLSSWFSHRLSEDWSAGEDKSNRPPAAPTVPQRSPASSDFSPSRAPSESARTEPDVDEFGFSIRPDERAPDSNPFGSAELFGEEEEDAGQKPQLLVRIRSAEESKVADADELLHAVKSMSLSAEGNETNMAVRNMLDIGLGAGASLFSEKSRRRAGSRTADSKHASTKNTPIVSPMVSIVEHEDMPHFPPAEPSSDSFSNMIFDFDPFAAESSSGGFRNEFDNHFGFGDPFSAFVGDGKLAEEQEGESSSDFMPFQQDASAQEGSGDMESGQGSESSERSMQSDKGKGRTSFGSVEDWVVQNRGGKWQGGKEEQKQEEAAHVGIEDGKEQGMEDEEVGGVAVHASLEGSEIQLPAPPLAGQSAGGDGGGGDGGGGDGDFKDPSNTQEQQSEPGGWVSFGDSGMGFSDDDFS